MEAKLAAPETRLVLKLGSLVVAIDGGGGRTANPRLRRGKNIVAPETPSLRAKQYRARSGNQPRLSMLPFEQHQ